MRGHKLYWIYLDMNLFIRAPVMEMQGKMEHIARVNRQFLANAKIKPVKNADMKLTESTTFSDKPCCTKSRDVYLLILGGGEIVNERITNGCQSGCGW